MPHYLMHQLIYANKHPIDYDYDHDDENNDDDVTLLIFHQHLLNVCVHDYGKKIIQLHLQPILKMILLTFFLVILLMVL